MENSDTKSNTGVLEAQRKVNALMKLELDEVSKSRTKLAAKLQACEIEREQIRTMLQGYKKLAMEEKEKRMSQMQEEVKDTELHANQRVQKAQKRARMEMEDMLAQHTRLVKSMKDRHARELQSLQVQLDAQMKIQEDFRSQLKGQIAGNERDRMQMLESNLKSTRATAIKIRSDLDLDRRELDAERAKLRQDRLQFERRRQKWELNVRQNKDFPDIDPNMKTIKKQISALREQRKELLRGTRTIKDKEKALIQFQKSLMLEKKRLEELEDAVSMQMHQLTTLGVRVKDRANSVGRMKRQASKQMQEAAKMIAEAQNAEKAILRMKQHRQLLVEQSFAIERQRVQLYEERMMTHRKKREVHKMLKSKPKTSAANGTRANAKQQQAAPKTKPKRSQNIKSYYSEQKGTSDRNFLDEGKGVFGPPSSPYSASELVESAMKSKSELLRCDTSNNNNNRHNELLQRLEFQLNDASDFLVHEEKYLESISLAPYNKESWLHVND